MKTKITLLAALMTCSCVASAQKFILEFGTEYATHSMTLLKDMQQQIFDDLPVRGKHVKSFPGFWGFNAKGMIGVRRFQFGLVAGINSTGARSAYEDYSGALLYDHLLKMNHIGAVCNFRLLPQETKGEFFFVLQTESVSTKYSLRSLIRLGDESQEETLEFTSKSFGIRPGIKYTYTFFGLLSTSAELGYMADLAGNLVYTKDKNLTLRNSVGGPIGADWSGIRLGVCVGVKL